MKKLEHVSKTDTISEWQEKFNKCIDFSHTLKKQGGDMTKLSIAGESVKDIVTAVTIVHDEVSTQSDDLGSPEELKKGDTVTRINKTNEFLEKSIGDINQIQTEITTSIAESIVYVKNFVGAVPTKSNLIEMVNTPFKNVGNLQLLKSYPTLKSSYELALNSLINQIGSKNLRRDLITDDASNMINSINSLLKDIESVSSLLGSFMNEVGELSRSSNNVTDDVVNVRKSIGDVNALTHIEWLNTVSGINTLLNIIGDMKYLSNTNRKTLIDSLNELKTWKKNTRNTYTQKRVSIGGETFWNDLNVIGTTKALKFETETNIKGNVDGNIIGNVIGDTTGSSLTWNKDIKLKLVGEIYGDIKFGGYDKKYKTNDVETSTKTVTVKSRKETVVNRFFPSGFLSQNHTFIEDGEYVRKRKYELSGYWEKQLKTIKATKYNPHTIKWTFEGVEYENFHYHAEIITKEIPVGNKWINTSKWVSVDTWVNKSYWEIKNTWVNTSKWVKKTIFQDNSYKYKKTNYEIKDKTPEEKTYTINASSKLLGTFSKGIHYHDDKYLKVVDKMTTTYVYIPHSSGSGSENSAWNEAKARISKSIGSFPVGSSVVVKYTNGHKWGWVKYKTGSTTSSWHRFI